MSDSIQIEAENTTAICKKNNTLTCSPQTETPKQYSPPALSLLFRVFFRAGLSTFGGGPAIIAVLETDCVIENNFFNTAEFVEDVALATAVPGAISVNLALLSGYRVRGLCGAVTAALGVITAPFFIITFILLWFKDILNNPVFNTFLSGAGAAVTGLIVISAFSIGRNLMKTGTDYIWTIIFIALTSSGTLSPLAGIGTVVSLNILGSRIFKRDITHSSNKDEKQG